MAGVLMLRTVCDGEVIERAHPSLDHAIEAAYDAVARREMTPDSVVDAEGVAYLPKRGSQTLCFGWG